LKPVVELEIQLSLPSASIFGGLSMGSAGIHKEFGGQM
jgi:hypothetical protein